MADIYMYEDVESGLADRIVCELKQAGGEDVTLHVNSYGGDVFEGKTVMHQLRKYEGAVTAIVEGVAASAASFIVVGGATRVIMAKGSRMMVHNALSMAFGNANELDRLSEQLRGQSQDIAEIYAERSGKPVDEWLAAMDEETWFTAEQAVTAGLADAVEESRVTNSALCSVSRVANLFKNQAQAPPKSLLEPVTRSESGDETTKPSDGQKGDAMSIKNLAQELGVEPDELRKKLSGFFNETVEVSGQVDVSYPEETAVAPTERVTVEPTVANTDGEAGGSLGLAFAVSNTPDGWDVTVDESTGAVTAKAPAGVEPGDTATATVVVNESTEVPVAFKVRALADDDEQPTSTEGVDAPAGEESTTTVTLDRDTYNLLVSQAKQGAQAASDKAREARIAEVDNWISEGRIAAAQRDKVLSVMHENEALAREVYGSNPKNTVPMAEVGHVGDGMPKSKAEELLAKADSIRNNKKGS